MGAHGRLRWSSGGVAVCFALTHSDYAIASIRAQTELPKTDAKEKILVASGVRKIKYVSFLLLGFQRKVRTFLKVPVFGLTAAKANRSASVMGSVNDLCEYPAK